MPEAPQQLEMMQSEMIESLHCSRWFFIPVFNESRAIGIIDRNIRTIRKYSHGARIFISDNCSADDTFVQLVNLQKQYPDEVVVSKQERNVGFAKNCLAIEHLPNGSLITLLGANDYLHPRGLKHLEHCIKSHVGAALVISNWSYYTNSSAPLGSRIYTGDVTKPFSTTSLDHYLDCHVYPPNGIMQYTGTKEALVKLGKYVDHLSNPQLGVFFEAFPQLVVACAGPPLALVKHVEATGWRSSKESIIRTHMLLMVEMNQLLRTARNKKKLSEPVYRRCLLAYLKAPIQLLSLDWGKSALPRSERERFVADTYTQVFEAAYEIPSLRLSLAAYCIKRRFLEYFYALRGVVWKPCFARQADIDPSADLIDRVHDRVVTDLRLSMSLFSWLFKRSKPVPSRLSATNDILTKGLAPANRSSDKPSDTQTQK